MRCPLQREIRQIGQGKLGTPPVELAADELVAENRQHLEIDEIGRRHPLAMQSCTCRVSVRAVISQCDGQHACVNDEHGHHVAS